jgi:hypothetical protein
MISLALFKSWLNVFFRPQISNFRDELHLKNHILTLANIVLGACLGFGLSWLIHLLFGQPVQVFMGIVSVWVEPGTQPPFSSWSLIVLGGVILGFFDFEIVLFIFARLLGGKGSFGTQAYLQLIFYAPLSIVQQIFAVIPIIGRPLFFLVAITSLIPTTTSLIATHGYRSWRAVATWLMPILLNVVVVFAVVKVLARP